MLEWAKSGTGDSLLSAETVQKRHQYDEQVPTAFALAYGMAQYKYVPGYVESFPFYKDFYGHSGDALGFGANAMRNDVLNVSIATADNTCGYDGLHDMVVEVVTEELAARQDMVPDDDSIPTDDMPVVNDDAIMETPAPTDEPTSSAFDRSMSVVVFGGVLLVLV